MDRAYAGPTTVLVPSEDVLTLTVDLPFPTRAQRLNNLPYALEDAVAEPLPTLHFALGQEIAPRRHIAGVVRHARMQGWLAVLDAADLETALLVPDALILPVPQAGAWVVRIEGQRALVRADNAAGFALPLSMLESAWAAAGRPRIVPLGDPLPETLVEGVDATAAIIDPSGDPLAVLPPLDLRQGSYAATRSTALSAGRTLALVAGIGVVVHIVILGIDALLLHGMADRKEQEARLLLLSVAPRIAAADDLVAAVEQLPRASGSTRPFTVLMSRTSQALPGAGVVAFNRVAYRPGDLNLDVVVPDASTLERAVAALNASGLRATGTPGVVDPSAAVTGLNAAITVSGSPG